MYKERIWNGQESQHPHRSADAAEPGLQITEIETDAQRRRRQGYLRGPFPLPAFFAAARLPGKALAIWLLVHHRVRVTRKLEVTLPSKLLVSAGIDRNAKARALRELEGAGLVRVVRKIGLVPRISLIQPASIW